MSASLEVLKICELCAFYTESQKMISLNTLVALAAASNGGIICIGGGGGGVMEKTRIFYIILFMKRARVINLISQDENSLRHQSSRTQMVV